MKTLPLVILCALLFVLPAQAQVSMHREVPQGEVTGLEMGIEGALRVTPGSRLRWFVTVHEIVHGRALRPAADATLVAEASFHRQEPVAKAITDESGHAELAFDIPLESELVGSFALSVKARKKQVMRQFDVTIELAPRYRTELWVDRQVFEPGETVFVFGRVMDATRERPAAQREVRVEALAQNHRPIAPAVTLKTDDAGLFFTTLPAPAEEGISFDVEAALSDGTASAKQAGLSTAAAAAPALLVYGAPLAPVVAPGTEVLVDVVVRKKDGSPVPRATLTGLSIPKGTPQKPVPPVVTDAYGRARVPWKVSSSEALSDVTGELQAVREGIGTGTGKVKVRVTRRSHALSWAVEGSAFIPGLPGQLIVRVYKPGGQPIAGTELRLTGDRLAPATARTDEQGGAVLQTSLRAKGATASASCAGDTVVAATLQVGQEEDELCLPVDPDATVGVRVAPLLAAGHPVEVRLQRVAAVATAPIEVTLLRSPEPGKWMPVAAALCAGAKDRVMLDVPAEARGLLWVRARPLFSPLRREIRGGGAAAWSALGRPPLLTLEKGNAEVQVALQGTHGTASGFVLALPVAAGEDLFTRLNKAAPGLSGASSLSELRGYLAANTPADEVVSAILRDGMVIPLPAPTDPVVQGRLRDPWRAEERFVRGRLARILHAIEHRIAESIPGALDEVAYHGPDGWRFNREILNLLLPELKADGLVGLDGSPLTIAALQALDPAITYDNAARRITRERLFRLYVALEHLVKDKHLEYAWSRRGDPGRWLLGLIDFSDGSEREAIKYEDLFDAWGHPFALRRIRDEKARFRFLQPVSGWEIVSAGPDGRPDTADDLAAPFARVLASGSVYAEAVGEDLLLSRLQQVELGRATVLALGEVFDIKAIDPAEPGTDAPRSSWSEPPTPLPDAKEVLAPAVVGPEPGLGGFARLNPAVNRVPLSFSVAPRRYLLIAGAYDQEGMAAFSARRATFGVPLLLDMAAPERLRQGERVRIPISLTYLGTPQEIRVRAEAGGAIEVSAAAPVFRLFPGDVRTIELEMTAKQRGSGQVRIVVATATGAVLLDTRKTVEVVGSGALRTQHLGRLVIGTDTARLTLPAHAELPTAQLIVSGARDLIADPGFLGLSENAPALAAWAYAQRGQSAPAALAAALSAWSPSEASPSVLQVACAVVALCAAADGEKPTPELSRALKWLAGARPTSFRERSAVLVALAALATAPTELQKGDDPVATLLREIREESWESLSTEQGHPTIMARLAAGLLLADRRDAIGRELYERARAALFPDGYGKRVLFQEDSGVDAFIGAAALAMAARQLGQDGVATELARGLAPLSYLGMGNDTEAGFWLLAASAYGVFGVATPEEVEVEVNGNKQRLPLPRGSAAIALPKPDARVTVRSQVPVLFRLQASYLDTAGAKSDAPLSVRIDGHLGRATETAALELMVEASGKQPIGSPVIELELPGLGALSHAARLQLAASSGVLRVDAQAAAGIVRIYLTSLDPQKPRRLPLPIHWLGSGLVSGLAITAYDAERPWRLTTLPARPLAIEPPLREDL